MSWDHDSARATWVEQHRETNAVRVQVATLLDAVPGQRPPTVPTPAVGDYADREILDQNGTYTLEGSHSGTVTIKKSRSFFNTVSEVEITYTDYSDDGEVFYNGKEHAKGSMMTKTTYTADLKATDRDGNEIGRMDVKLLFSAAYGLHTITKQITSPVLNVGASHGTASWMGSSADISALVQ